MNTISQQRFSGVLRLFIPVGCCIVVLILLSCIGKDQNPFSNPSKAAILISPAYFYSNDSTATDSIFQTFTFSVSLDLPEQIKTIIIHTENNRLWKNADSVLEGPSLAGTVWPERYSVSFSDTGWHSVWIKAVLQNNDTVSSWAGKIYARTPLSPGQWQRYTW